MTNATIAHQRLFNQRLAGKKFKTPFEVVSWMGAVQGQEYPYAKWALGLRLDDATDEVVEKAFNDGEILRTHVMRPTWHFVTRADIRWLVELTARRVDAAMAYGYRQAGLERTIAKRTNAAIARALRGGNQLTRPELRRVLERAGVEVKTALRMGVFMMWAELDAVVCSGPRRGIQFTYMLLDERAPDAKSLRREEALVELTRRYFSSHGPATAHDFAWWSGLTLTDVSAGLAMVGCELKHDKIDGHSYWFASSTRRVKESSPTAHLLPVLDEYIVAYRDASIIFAPEFSKQGKNRNFVSSVVLDGRVVGEWKPVPQDEMVVIDLQLYAPLTKMERRTLEVAAARYGEFLGRQVTLQETQSTGKGKGK